MKSSFEPAGLSELVAAVEATGAQLVPDGDKLRVRGVARLSAELLTRIRECKAELLTWLANRGQPAEIAGEASSLSNLLAAVSQLADDITAVCERLLAVGERLGFPAVRLGPGRTLACGRIGWELFIRASLPTPHEDVKTLLCALEMQGRTTNGKPDC